jgi:hypothetical protein
MNSNDIAKADGLSENDLELLGISEPTTKKAAPRLNNRWWPVAILVLTAVLFQLIVVSCQRSSSALREGDQRTTPGSIRFLLPTNHGPHVCRNQSHQMRPTFTLGRAEAGLTKAKPVLNLASRFPTKMSSNLCQI